MSSDDIVDLTVDLKDRLPDVVIKEWLPAEDRSIFFLFQEFNRYPPHPSHYILPTNFQLVLHQDPIQGFIYESLLRIPPPALPSVTEAYQDMIKKSKNPTLSVTLQPQYGNPITPWVPWPLDPRWESGPGHRIEFRWILPAARQEHGWFVKKISAGSHPKQGSSPNGHLGSGWWAPIAVCCCTYDIPHLALWFRSPSPKLLYILVVTVQTRYTVEIKFDNSSIGRRFVQLNCWMGQK